MLFYCEQCQKLLTLKQSKRIACVHEKDSNDAFIDLDGHLYSPHSFSELNLLAENTNVFGTSAPCQNSSALTQPVDISQFVRFFREKYRLCWKEIYLKFSSISRLFEPELCTKCCKWFRISDIASCSEPDEKVSSSFVHFHHIDPERNMNAIVDEDIQNIKKQI